MYVYKNIGKKYNITNCNKTFSTPMEVNLMLQKIESLNGSLKYRNIIGALLYVNTATRPGI